MRRQHGHVIVRAYAATHAIDRPCPECSAEPAQWCTTPDGRDRRIPCIARTRPVDNPEVHDGQPA